MAACWPGAAGHVDHAPNAELFEQTAIEGPFVGQPLRPIDHGVINVGQVFEDWPSCEGILIERRNSR